MEAIESGFNLYQILKKLKNSFPEHPKLVDFAIDQNDFLFLQSNKDNF